MFLGEVQKYSIHNEGVFRIYLVKDVKDEMIRSIARNICANAQFMPKPSFTTPKKSPTRKKDGSGNGKKFGEHQKLQNTKIRRNLFDGERN